MDKNKSRRKEDRTWSVTPSWIDNVMSVCKYFLYVMPFICISIAMLLEPSALSLSYVITSVWCLSLLKLIDILNK
jgi:hypothetical protein